jgi:hypothetical protein
MLFLLTLALQIMQATLTFHATKQVSNVSRETKGVGTVECLHVGCDCRGSPILLSG